MTITELVRARMEKFLKSSVPEVLCVRGPWGVGKTYLWKETLASQAELPLRTYSYVSLFGVDSLDALKMSIYANQVMLGAKSRSWLQRKGKQAQPLLEEIPHVGALIKALGTFYFSTIKEQIICIDDLERRSKSLEVKDVLGLISFLKEERRCKIVLLLNDGELDEESGKVFLAHFEKTVDIHVRFDATSEESAAIGVPLKDALADSIRAHCAKLRIANIRIIQKIDRMSRELVPILDGFDPTIVESAVKSVALLTWSHLKGAGAPTIEHLRKRTGLSILHFDKETKLSDEEKQWNTVLDEFDWGSLDELDKELITSIDVGAFDPAKIKAAATVVQDVLILRRQDGDFEDSWRGYHDSFDDNKDELLDNMYATFMKTYKTISLGNLDGTVRLFRDLGRNAQADELLKFYIENRAEHQSFWDLANNPFGGDIKDAAVKKAIKDKFESFGTAEVNLEELLEAMGSADKGWNMSDVDAAAVLPVSEYRTLFKTERGRKLRRIVKGGLSAFRTVNAPPAMKKVAELTVAALREIGAESEINARRVEHFYQVPMNPDHPAAAAQVRADEPARDE